MITDRLMRLNKLKLLAAGFIIAGFIVFITSNYNFSGRVLGLNFIGVVLFITALLKIKVPSRNN